MLIEYRPILTGLHALLFPKLIYTGFKVFDKEHIRIICDLSAAGKFTTAKPGDGDKLGKKGKAILGKGGLTFWFDISDTQNYLFDIYPKGEDICAFWEIQRDVLWGRDLLTEAVQQFELAFQSRNI